MAMVNKDPNVDLKQSVQEIKREAMYDYQVQKQRESRLAQIKREKILQQKHSDTQSVFDDMFSRKMNIQIKPAKQTSTEKTDS